MYRTRRKIHTIWSLWYSKSWKTPIISKHCYSAPSWKHIPIQTCAQTGKSYSTLGIPTQYICILELSVSVLLPLENSIIESILIVVKIPGRVKDSKIHRIQAIIKYILPVLRYNKSFKVSYWSKITRKCWKFKPITFSTMPITKTLRIYATWCYTSY